MRVLVLGGTGFIGRHAAAALAARGHEVCVGTRHPARARRRTRAETIEVHFEDLASRAAWHPILAGFDAVVNSVGILRPRRAETYDAVHHRAPAALAGACALAGRRLVHVSALGLHPAARSGFIRSKIEGELAVAASAADYSIVRPSLLDGEGGFGARWFRRVARWPVHFLPGDALGRIDALDVGDLGEAIAVLAEKRNAGGWREVELGGGMPRTLGDYLAALRPAHLRPAPRIAVPALLARVASHLFDVVHFSPLSFGHIELMRRDNVPSPNRLPDLLGRAPARVGSPSVADNAYGWRAVARNVVPLLLLLAVAPWLAGSSAVAPWLLAPLIGLFMYRITIVMHDCIHRSLFASPRLNARVGTLLGGITGIDFASFARQHLLHHRLYGRPGDPQGFHYLGLERKTRAGVLWHLVRPLLGANLRPALAESLLRPRNLAAAARRGELLPLTAMQLAILFVVTDGGAHPWLALLPFASAATFGLFFSQLRGIAEHAGDGTPGIVRSHAAHWLDRALLYDLDFNYHREHHLFPHVPSRDLGALAVAAGHERSMLCTIGGLAWTGSRSTTTAPARCAMPGSAASGSA